MNQAMAENIAWVGGLAGTIIGLIMMIAQVISKGESLPENSKESKCQKSFLLTSWVLFFIVMIIGIVMIKISPARTGMRGAYATGIAAMFIPVFLASMESLTLRKKTGKDKVLLFVFASLPAGGIGLSLLLAGFISVFYGIKAFNLWTAFIIGSALGLYILRLSSTLVKFSRYESIAGKMETVMYMVMALVCAVIMAGYHFPNEGVKIYLPILLGISIFIISLISISPFKCDKKTGILEILPYQITIFLVLYLGCAIFLISRLAISYDYLNPIICGAVTSALLIILLFNSSSEVKGVDLSLGALSVLLFIGGIWLSFKWSMGFGITLYAMSLLSVASIIVPHKSFETVYAKLSIKSHKKPAAPENKDILLEGEAEPAATKEIVKNVNPEKNENKNESMNEDIDDNLTWAKLFTSGINVIGMAAVLVCIHRVLIQSTNLLNMGIDITSWDISIALLLGVFIPLFFEGFNLAGPNIFFIEKEEGLPSGLWRFAAAVIVTGVTLFCIGIFFGLQGMGAFVLGLSISAVLSVFAFFSQKITKGIYRASHSPLWIAAAGAVLCLSKYKDLPYKFTRSNKQELIIILAIAADIIYIISFYYNKRKQKAS